MNLREHAFDKNWISKLAIIIQMHLSHQKQKQREPFTAKLAHHLKLDQFTQKLFPGLLELKSYFTLLTGQSSQTVRTNVNDLKNLQMTDINTEDMCTHSAFNNYYSFSEQSVGYQ